MNIQKISFGHIQTFFRKVMTIIDSVALCKTKQLRGGTQNWFDRKVLEKLSSRDELSENFNKIRLHINKE